MRMVLKTIYPILALWGRCSAWHVRWEEIIMITMDDHALWFQSERTKESIVFDKPSINPWCRSLFIINCRVHTQMILSTGELLFFVNTINLIFKWHAKFLMIWLFERARIWTDICASSDFATEMVVQSDRPPSIIWRSRGWACEGGNGRKRCIGKVVCSCRNQL